MFRRKICVLLFMIMSMMIWSTVAVKVRRPSGQFQRRLHTYHMMYLEHLVCLLETERQRKRKRKRRVLDNEKPTSMRRRRYDCIRMLFHEHHPFNSFTKHQDFLHRSRETAVGRGLPKALSNDTGGFSVHTEKNPNGIGSRLFI